MAAFDKRPGLYVKRKNLDWQKIHPTTPLNYWHADIDGDGKDNIIANFGPKIGTFARQVNGVWTLLYAGAPTNVEAADIDGNGRDDLAFYINFNKVLVRMDSGKWLTVWNGLTRILAAGDIDGNGKDDLVFSSLNGRSINAPSTWVWMNNNKWAELASSEAISIYGANMITCDQFSGICAYVAAPGFRRGSYTFANLDGR